MNSINLIGRLSADVELKQTSNGTSVCSFTIAVNRPRVKDTTDWINCVAWRHNAEFIAKYFKKGQAIAISGVLTSRKFKDQNDKTHTAFEVVADSAEFCGGKNSANSNDPNFEEVDGDDDLPF